MGKKQKRRDVKQSRFMELLSENKNKFREGDKVRIDIDNLRSNPNWSGRDQDFRSFVETNADVVFTVEYDEKYRENPYLVTLKEDDSEVKWLFWVGDLVKEKLVNRRENIT